MSSIVENYIQKARNGDYSNYINNVFKTIVLYFKKYINKIKIQIRIEKNKLELKKKYKKLGEFVNKSYISDNVIDFSYQDRYFQLNKEIYILDKYLTKLERMKNSF